MSVDFLIYCGATTSLISSDTFKGIETQSAEYIDSTSLVQFSISTANVAPIRQPPRHGALGKCQIEREEIDKILQRGIIEPSKSAWSSPVVLVTKSDGSPRFCVDYRRLNDVTVKEAYPLPRVDECLNALSVAKYFSSLNLACGFGRCL